MIDVILNLNLSGEELEVQLSGGEEENEPKAMEVVIKRGGGEPIEEKDKKEGDVPTTSTASLPVIIYFHDSGFVLYYCRTKLYDDVCHR